MAIAVTALNFSRAETDLYFGNFAKGGGFGKFFHIRQPTPIDHQTVIRMNRDTVYSAGIFDLDASPVTVTLPDPGNRFMSMQVINEDQYTYGVYYDVGSYTFTREQIGTRYVALLVRTLVTPSIAGDLDQVHALQDAIGVQQASVGTFEVPEWDQESQKKVREALLALASTIGDFTNTFGNKEEVDPILFLIGSAAGWGGNPDKDAKYVNFSPEKNDGETVYKLNVQDVPVDGFWSISMYNAEGYFQQNEQNAYSLNNLTAMKDADGSITVQFGGCDGDAPNCLPITPGWNYIVRLYRPRPEVLSGEWTFPGPTLVG